MKRTIPILLVALAMLGLLSIKSGAQTTTSAIKLFRFGSLGSEKPAVMRAAGKSLDVSAFGEEYNETFFATNGIQRLEKWLATNVNNCPAVPSGVRMAACIARPSKIVAIGLNYAEHAKEGGAPIPREPVIFLKATTSLSGPYDPVILPQNSEKVDWEAELAIVIGKKASYVSENKALDYVAGYTLINDYSERTWQLNRDGGQWDKGKSSDSFGPLGPYLVTPAGVGDPQNLKIWLKVNGETMQESNTSDMIYKIPALIAQASQYMTLLPGDVIATGTPAGVGLGHKPPHFLKPGDVVELGIERIGEQKQTAISYIQSQLTANEYADYQNWVALGVGGIPHTLAGYRIVSAMNKKMGNPLDVSRLAPLIGRKEDRVFLKKLPKRQGTKPNIAPFAVPHRQTDQHNDTSIRTLQEQLFDTEVARNTSLLRYQMSGFERHNKAIFLKDTLRANLKMVKSTHGEIGHIHPTDGSMHLTFLSPSDAKTVIQAGWGEFHGLAGDGQLSPTYMMLYSPRNEKELAITKQILEAAIKYAALQPTP